MRCQQCQSEISSDHLTDDAPVSCAVCGIVQTQEAEGTAEAARSPQEILARWTNKRFLDPYGPILNRQPNDKRSTVQKLDTASRGMAATSGRNSQDPPTPWTASDILPKPDGIPAEPEQPEPKETPVAVTKESSKPAPEVVTRPTLNVETEEIESDDIESDDAELESFEDADFQMPGSRGYSIRIDEAHALHSPHVMIKPVEERIGASWLSVVGQLLAYVGVGALTCGTIMVLIGLHGARPELTPTGWLVSTAGQMLLFLGVVTLVSAGMEQTARQVSNQVERLGDRLIRVEQKHREVPAPNFQKKVSPQDPRATVAKLRRRVAELERQLGSKQR